MISKRPGLLEQAMAPDYAAERLDTLGLAIHPDTTRVVRSSSEVSFLGERLPNPNR